MILFQCHGMLHGHPSTRAPTRSNRASMPRFFPYAPQGRGNFSHAPQAAYRSIVSSLPYLIGDLDPRPERRNASPFPTSVGQTSTAPGTAAGQDLAAIRGGHTLAEAVLLRALALLRLIGTKHGGHLLVQVQTPSIGRRIQTGVTVQQQPFGCGLYTNSPAKKGRKTRSHRTASLIID